MWFYSSGNRLAITTKSGNITVEIEQHFFGVYSLFTLIKRSEILFTGIRSQHACRSAAAGGNAHVGLLVDE